jgi:hydroxyacylglutathione hydrolase
MVVEQIYTGCLAQGAYYISSNGEAAVIDPLREVQPYLDRAEKEGSVIRYIFETHFHADFVSGHLDLAAKTGAPIVFGPSAKPGFEALIAEDGKEFKIGKLTLRVLHTPGHTMESTCYLLIDENGKEHCLFSGDTLFLGDVGRPDLAQKANDVTQEDLAGFLYDSLMNKIMPLPDDLIVYPAHGAGSACGKNMMKETSDTLGHQKAMNYALRQPDKAAFVKAVTEGLTPPPAYFPANVAMNRDGYISLDTVKSSALQPLTPKELETIVNEIGALVLDTRAAGEFAKGFVPRSINIGLDGQFAPWVGALIADTEQALVLVVEEGREEETVTRLARVGFDHVLGYLKGGIAAWHAAGKEIDTVHRITAAEFAATVQVEKDIVLDVRREGEYEGGHVKGSVNKPLDYINEWFADTDESQTTFLHCAGGYRSMTAASILKARGIHQFKEVEGGFAAIRQHIPVEVLVQ